VDGEDSEENRRRRNSCPLPPPSPGMPSEMELEGTATYARWGGTRRNGLTAGGMRSMMASEGDVWGELGQTLDWDSLFTQYDPGTSGELPLAQFLDFFSHELRPALLRRESQQSTVHSEAMQTPREHPGQLMPGSQPLSALSPPYPTLSPLCSVLCWPFGCNALGGLVYGGPVHWRHVHGEPAREPVSKPCDTPPPSTRGWV